MSLKIVNKNFYINFMIIFSIFVLDRITKFYVLNDPVLSSGTNVALAPFININLTWNEGIAFGLLSFENMFYYNILTILIISIVLIILWFSYKSHGLERFCFLIIAGGASGNLFDRIFYSSVPDFIDISINNYHWFIFNIADIFISVGVIILIILECFKKKVL